MRWGGDAEMWREGDADKLRMSWDDPDELEDEMACDAMGGRLVWGGILIAADSMSVHEGIVVGGGGLFSPCPLYFSLMHMCLIPV